MNIREGAREEAAWKVYLHETTTLCLGGSPPGNQLSPVQGGGAGGSSAFVKTRLFRPSLYNTKSDLTVVFVMLRRYVIFCLIGNISRVKKYIFSPGDLRPVHQSPVAAVRVGRPVVAAEHDVNVQALRHGEFPGGYLDLGVALVAGEGYPRQQVRRVRPGGVEVPHDQLVIGPGETVLAGRNGPVDEQRPSVAAYFHLPRWHEITHAEDEIGEVVHAQRHGVENREIDLFEGRHSFLLQE